MQGPASRVKRWWHWTSWLLWGTPAAVLAVLVFLRPHDHTVTPIYHNAVTNWRASEAVYTGPSGFNYLPSFLLFFGLFARLPLIPCEIVWRWAALAGLGLGLWRCTGLMELTHRYRAFAIVTVLSLPVCLSALRNGQSSAQLAAALVLAADRMHTKRWWCSTFWLSLALVCKPLGLAAIGLAVVTFPRLWWRLAVGVAVVLASPYFFGPTAYVNEQYVAFAQNLSQCLDTGRRTFADLNGLLMVLNLKLTGTVSLLVRVASGAGMAVACWFIGRLGSDVRRAFLWLGLTGIYLMLFTPMNESNSYVMLAPAFGLWAWWHVEQGETRAAQLIAVMSLTMAVLPELLRPMLGKIAGNQFAKFWYPLMALIFLGMLLKQMNRGQKRFDGDRGQPACTEELP